MPRLLCLHGTCTSSSVLRDMIKPLMLQLNVEFVFIDGQLKREDVMPDKPVVEAILAGWPTAPQLMYAQKQQTSKSANGREDDFTAQYKDLEEAVSYLYQEVSALAKELPFDGILGYSQGANPATILAGAAAKGLIPHQRAFRFVTCFCGNDFGWARQASLLPGHEDIFPVRCPAVLVRGLKDPLTGRCEHQRFADLYDESQRVTVSHKSGHMPFGPDVLDTWRLAQCIRHTVEAAMMDLGQPPDAHVHKGTGPSSWEEHGRSDANVASLSVASQAVDRALKREKSYADEHTTYSA